MKEIKFLKFNIVLTFVALAALLMLFSCQSEEVIVVDEPKDNQKIIPSSVFSKLLLRVVQNPTESDNIIDKSSCVSVKLPVNVTINNITFTASSYEQVQNAINSVQNPTIENTTVHMTFPIQVLSADYNILSIISQQQMDETLYNCGVDSGENEIDCIQIKYPVAVATYNKNLQRIATININNNIEFYRFVKNGLDNQFIATIKYPLEITGTAGQKLIVNNNDDLEALIRNAVEICD